LAPGTSVTVEITFTLDPNFQGTDIENTAQITEADDDTDPNNDPPTDVDSDPGLSTYKNSCSRSVFYSCPR